MRRKHVPQRTCVGCRKIRPKREMVRIVEKRLEYALKTGLSQEEWEALLGFGQTLERTDEAVKG